MALTYSTGGNPQSGSFVTPTVDSVIANLMDWGNMPAVRKMLVGAHPKQYGLDMMMGLDMIHETVQGNNYWWFENNLFIKVPTIGATPTTDANYVYLTYDAQSHENSGKNSWGRPQENVMLENGLQGQIYSKNTTVDSAHVIAVKPTGFNSSGSAVTVAQLAAGVTIGQSIITLGNATYEGAAGLDDSILSTQTSFSNNLQNTTEVDTVSFNQLNTKGWFELDLDLPKSGISGESPIFNKSAAETQVRLERSVLTTIFTGSGGTGVDPVDTTKTVPLTKGWLTTLLDLAAIHPYYKIDRKYFEGIRALGRNTFSQGAEEMEYNALVGDDWRSDSEEFLVAYKLNRPDKEEMSKINTSFKYIECCGVKVNILPFPIMSDPFTYGKLGSTMSSMAIFTPAGTTSDKDGTATPSTIMRYMARPNSKIMNGKPWYEAEVFGFSQANEKRDITSIRYKTAFGGETHRGSEAIISQKIV